MSRKFKLNKGLKAMWILFGLLLVERAYFFSGHSEPCASSWVPILSAQGQNNPVSYWTKVTTSISGHISAACHLNLSSQQALVKVNAYFPHRISVVFPNSHPLARDIFSSEA